jgi:hypothetical protein
MCARGGSLLLSLPLFVAGAHLVACVGSRRRGSSLRVLMAGLLAGAFGAWIYAFHCDESAAPFRRHLVHARHRGGQVRWAGRWARGCLALVNVRMHGALVNERPKCIGPSTLRGPALVFAELHRVREYLGVHVVAAIGGQGAGSDPSEFR